MVTSQQMNWKMEKLQIPGIKTSGLYNFYYQKTTRMNSHFWIRLLF